MQPGEEEKNREEKEEEKKSGDLDRQIEKEIKKDQTIKSNCIESPSHTKRTKYIILPQTNPSFPARQTSEGEGNKSAQGGRGEAAEGEGKHGGEEKEKERDSSIVTLNLHHKTANSLLAC